MRKDIRSRKVFVCHVIVVVASVHTRSSPDYVVVFIRLFVFFLCSLFVILFVDLHSNQGNRHNKSERYFYQFECILSNRYNI